MDRAVARARLARMVAADSRPVLAPTAVDDVLDQARRADLMGRSITDADWVPTFDLNWAAMTLWQEKAALVAGDFDFSADGSSVHRSDVIAHCKEMADHYGARVRGSASTAPYADPSWNGPYPPGAVLGNV